MLGLNVNFLGMKTRRYSNMRRGEICGAENSGHWASTGAIFALLHQSEAEKHVRGRVLDLWVKGSF